LDLRLAVGQETLALVGPSGAGKSSVLRAIAGLLTPNKGCIVCAGRPLLNTERHVNLPPEDRRVGLVFQDGALFPHMTVAQNIAYALWPHPRGRRNRRARVGEILEQFTIASLASARPARISGGEQQRAAIARAVATSPDVLLLDEPLSSLDTVTKDRIVAELSSILTSLCLPTVLVSHDFGDVAGLAQRIAVMDAGRIVQSGTPAELLHTPRSAFVAAFTGTNYFTGNAKRDGAATRIDLDGGGQLVSDDSVAGRVGVVVQPWHVAIRDASDRQRDMNTLIGPVLSLVPHGNALRVSVASTPAIVAEVPASAPRAADLTAGAIVAATWPQALTRLVLDDTDSVG
jgi:molybdate transport system ATP-binding protein